MPYRLLHMLIDDDCNCASTLETLGGMLTLPLVFGYVGMSNLEAILGNRAVVSLCYLQCGLSSRTILGNIKVVSPCYLQCDLLSKAYGHYKDLIISIVVRGDKHIRLKCCIFIEN